MAVTARYVDAASGDIVERVVDATDPHEAEQRLAGQGHVVIAVHAPRFGFFSARRPRLDLHAFCLELRTLLAAGIGVVPAIDAIAQAQHHPAHRDALKAVLAQLHQGKPLSTALRASANDFPSMFCTAMLAGERSGQLPESLSRYAEYIDGFRRLRQTVVSALIYPAIVVGFGLLVLLFLLAYVLPRFAVAYQALPPGVSQGSSVVLGIATLMSEYSAWIGLVVLGMVLLGAWGLSSSAGRSVLRWTALRVPGVMRGARAYHLARFFRTLSMMLHGGFSVPQAVRLGAEVTSGTSWQAMIEQAGASIERGKAPSDAFSTEGLLTPITMPLIRAGESSGHLAQTCAFAAGYHERELARLLERSGRLAEPLLLMAVALMIGLIVLVMYMPILDLAGSVHQ
jgi:general secretion pathway protein F